MNKKLLVPIIASAMVFGPTQFVSAEEGELDNPNSHEIELVAEVAAGYTVKLPSKFDVKANSSTFKIQIKGDLAGDDVLQVTMPETVTLKEVVEGQNKHSDIEMSIASTKEQFTYNDIKSTYQTDGETTVTITHDTIPAGKWSAKLPVVIGYVTD